MESRLSRRALLLGMLALGLPVSAGAEGFPGGVRDAYGPRFGPRLGLRDLGDRRRRHGAGAAGTSATGTSSPSTPVASTTPRCRPATVASSESRWGPGDRVGPWPSSTSRSSTP